MSIDMAAKKAGIQLQRDVPVPGQRRARDWATLIGTARKLEAEEAQRERDRNSRIEELADQVVGLTQANMQLSKELAELRLKERLAQIELPRKDAQFLLTGEKVSA